MVRIAIAICFILLGYKIVAIGCFYVTSGSQVVKEKRSFYFELAVFIDFFLLNFFFCLDYSRVNNLLELVNL